MMKDKWPKFPRQTRLQSEEMRCVNTLIQICFASNTMHSPRSLLGKHVIQSAADFENSPLLSSVFLPVGSSQHSYNCPEFRQLSKPSGNFTCRHVQQYKILRSAYIWISEQTAIISPYNINGLVFITETGRVYCAVRTASI